MNTPNTPQKPNRPQSGLRFTLRVLSSAVIALMALLVLAMSLPGAFGLRAFAVLSPSMEPTLPRGALIYVKPCGFTDMSVGDIASFQSQKDPGRRFTHRVVGLDPAAKLIYTQGDNNGGPDPLPSTADALIGRAVFWIPLAGFPAALFQSGTATVIAAVLLIVWAAVEIELLRQRRKKRSDRP